MTTSTKMATSAAAKAPKSRKPARESTGDAKKTAAKTTAKAPAKTGAKAASSAPRKPALKPAEKTSAPRPRKKKAADIDPALRQHYIEVSAYYIAERRGFHGGRELEDWAQAEAEIDRLLAEGKLSLL